MNDNLMTELLSIYLVSFDDDGKETCGCCKGVGWIEEYYMDSRFGYQPEVVNCPICKGFGITYQQAANRTRHPSPMTCGTN